MNNGESTDQYSYTDFGEIISQVGTTENPFQYVGRYGVMTEPNDLMYMRMRYYDSETGRFIIPDPLENLSYYVYTGNNPIVRVDPLGLWQIDISVALSFYIKIGGGLSIGSKGIYVHGDLGFAVGIPTPMGPLPEFISGSVMFSPTDPIEGLSGSTSGGAIIGYKTSYRPQDLEGSWAIGLRVPGVSSGGSYTTGLEWKEIEHWIKSVFYGIKSVFKGYEQKAIKEYINTINNK